MNYLRHYCNLIRKAENRTPPEGYTEKHHVFPISIYGKNNKVVVLTAREHYVAHALLEKIYIKRYGKNHIYAEKMTYAHLLMNDGKRYYNSFLYENVRKKVSDLHSKRFSGKNNPRYGKIGVYKHTEETKIKIRESSIGKKMSKDSIEKTRNANIGRKHSEDMKEKNRQSHLGKRATEETKNKMKEARKNKKWWTDGKVNKLSIECPGKNWKRGVTNYKSTNGYKWWNDGHIDKYMIECPGQNWKRGRVKKVNETKTNTDTTTVG